MPTDSDPSNFAAVICTNKAINEILSLRWPNLANLFTEENISSALLKAVNPDRLDSEGNYKPSARYLQMWGYNPILNEETKPDLFLIKDEIVRAVEAAAATDAN